MITIKTAIEADAAAVALLIRRSFVEQAAELGVTSIDCPSYVAFETELGVRRRIATGGQVILAYAGEELVGTVSCGFRAGDARRGEIGRLAVLPSHRGRDCGRKLMAHAESELVTAGAVAVELSIVARFRRLRTYYESLGYSAMNLRRIPGLPFEVLFMEKDLTRTPALATEHL